MIASSPQIEYLKPGMEAEYQEFVNRHPNAGYCHDFAWHSVIEKTYRKSSAYFISRSRQAGRVNGVLPAFHLSSPLFGKQLVSLPYLDAGGILAETEEVERGLLKRFLGEATRHRAASEMRCNIRLASMEPPLNTKVGMVVELEGLDESRYWKKLDAKVRNQVRKAEKSQVTLRWGRHELLSDFYAVFARNMRDLGSPVHARAFFSNLLNELPGAAIGAAYRDGRCIGGLVRVLWRDTLAIPWASTLREERVHCPNNALYYESIRFALSEKCRIVDLGRSTISEGTFHFKLQWQAREMPLPWYQFDRRGVPLAEVQHASSGCLAPLTAIWAKLPLALANILGPRLRSSIAA
jgi:serine/alanine adding enzyme